MIHKSNVCGLFTHPRDFCTQTQQEKSRIKRYVSDLLEGTSVPPSQATKAYGRSSSGLFTFDECNAIAASAPGVALAFPLFFCAALAREPLFFWSNDLVVPNFYSMRHAIFYAATHVWLKFFLQLICFQTKSEMSLLPRPPKPTDSSNTFGLRLASAVTFRPK